MKQTSFIFCLWSTVTILIAVATASPTSFSGDTINNGELRKYKAETEYIEDPERKISKTQVQTNSVSPELEHRHKLKSIEYECGIVQDDVRQTPETTYVCNFYNHIMKTNNDYTAAKDSLEKCFGFVCNWHKAACTSDENSKNNNDLKSAKQKQTQCACMIKFWQKYSCAKVFHTDDVTEDENDENVELEDNTDKNTKEKQDSSSEENNENNSKLDLATHRKKRAADDYILFSDSEETTTKKQSTSDIILRRFSMAERTCFADKKILFRGECHTIGTEEPCGKDYWLVLQKPSGPGDNRDNSPRPVCKQKSCPRMDEIWWPSMRRCIAKSSAKSTVCGGENMKVEVDLFGDGVCECAVGYGIIQGYNGCHSYYQQGPCEFGNVVTHDVTSGFAICTPDLCAEENNGAIDRSRRSSQLKNEIPEHSTNHHVSHYRNTAIKKRQTQRGLLQPKIKQENSLDAVGLYDKDLIKINPEEYHAEVDRKRQAVVEERIRIRRQAGYGMKLFAPMNGNGTCYKLGSAAVCGSIGPNSRFVINVDLHLPVCSKSLELHLIDGAPKCKADENNMCRDVVQVKQESDLDFYLHMMSQIKSKRDTRRQG